MGRRAIGAIATLSAGLALAAAPAVAQVSFTQVADTSTLVPGGAMSETFSAFGAPALDGGQVAFQGFGTMGQAGIYRDGIGALGVVADLGTAIPDGTGNFMNFFFPALQGGQVAFNGSAFNASGPGLQQGVYRDVGGTLTRIADLTTPIPDGSGTFSGFGLVSVDGGQIGFEGSGLSGQSGIYRDGVGALTTIVNTNTAVPDGTGTFTIFNNSSLAGGRVAFVGLGTSGERGVYRTGVGALTRIADLNTAIPGGTGNFTDFSDLSTDGDQIAFDGFRPPDQFGVYRSEAGTLTVIADRNSAIPGGTGNFLIFDATSVDGGQVAFAGRDSSLQGGIYLERGGALQRVVAAGDLIDGRLVSSVILGPQGLSGDQLAFVANFSDQSRGLFIAELPVSPSEPVM